MVAYTPILLWSVSALRDTEKAWIMMLVVHWMLLLKLLQGRGL